MKKQRVAIFVAFLLACGFLTASDVGSDKSGRSAVKFPREWLKGSIKTEIPKSDEAQPQTCANAATYVNENHKCEDAMPGCEACSRRVPGSWGVREPYHTKEFGHRRTSSSTWQPILRALDAETRKRVPGKRLIIDIGYTGSSDMEWLAGAYAAENTNAVAFEPHPTTYATMRNDATHYSDKGIQAAVLNLGLGDQDYMNKQFWFNRDSSHSSFQRVRGDDYEQVPTLVNVSMLDTLITSTDEIVIPIMKVSAGRWEDLVLKGASSVLRNVAVVVADVTAIPANSEIIPTLRKNNFTVYGLGCSSLARIHQDRPYWWSSVIAIKGFLTPIAEQYVCWDFTASTLLCDSPEAALYAPQGCHNFSAVLEPHRHDLAPDTDPVETTRMASPATHKKLKYVFLTIIALSVGVMVYDLFLPLGLVLLNNFKANDTMPVVPTDPDDWDTARPTRVGSISY
eukprot:TRINITY_DN1115_c0_g3_i1.p1 TRINITY_DN1115_c0_g3~~TRINITY_DN1115_c0_g3_i1.p1  ORF type:complete len:454 (+),score=36.76 TRINITY_DN1115_c0_g3_i1:105-1466(+)